MNKLTSDAIDELTLDYQELSEEEKKIKNQVVLNAIFIYKEEIKFQIQRLMGGEKIN